MAAPEHVNTQAMSPGDRRIYDERFGKADTLMASDAYHRAKDAFENSQGRTVLVSSEQANEVLDRNDDLPDTQRLTRGKGGSIAHLPVTEAEGIKAPESDLAKDNTTAEEFYGALGKGPFGEEDGGEEPQPATPKVGKDVQAKDTAAQKQEQKDGK